MGRLVLITRPFEQSDIISQCVRNLGLEPCVEPLLVIETLRSVWPELSGYDGLILTSGNAVSSIPFIWRQSGLPVFTVGDHTAALARQVGFRAVFSAGGDAAALGDLLSAQSLRAGTKLLHPCGGDETKHVSFSQGEIVRLPVYEARAVEKLSLSLLTKLDQREIGAALFYSPRTGRIFADRVAEQGRTHCLDSIKALCLSVPVVQSLEHLPWRDVQCAVRPDQPAMLELLTLCMNNSGPTDGR